MNHDMAFSDHDELPPHYDDPVPHHDDSIELTRLSDLTTRPTKEQACTSSPPAVVLPATSPPLTTGISPLDKTGNGLLFFLFQQFSFSFLFRAAI